MNAIGILLNKNMENVNTTSNSNTSQNKFEVIFKKKWIFVLIGVGIVIVFLLVLTLNFSKSEQDAKNESNADLHISNVPFVTAAKINPTQENVKTSFTSEQLKTIEQQHQADITVGKREYEIRTNFPWFVKLPLRGEKYFVYFETNSKVFTGLVYPKSGDNVDAIKAEVLSKLKNLIGIKDLEKYQFEWKITPE